MRQKWLAADATGWAWFKRQKQLIDKMNLAVSKFEGEVDLKNIIAAMRTSKFVAKMQTNKRQRNSIAYFRRYAIDD